MSHLKPIPSAEHCNGGATFNLGSRTYKKCEEKLGVSEIDYSNRFDDYDYYWRLQTSAFSDGFSDGFS